MFIVSALFLSVAQPVPAAELGAPPSIAASLLAIRRPLGFAGECADLHPDLSIDDQYKRLEDRYLSAVADAKGTWGGEVDDPGMDLGKRPWPSCKRKYVSEALGEAEKALEAHSALFRKLTLVMDRRGLWAGPLKICREHIESAQLASDDTGRPALMVNLTKEAGGSWSEITGRSIGKPLHIRLDGKVIASPIVYERIDANAFQITGPDEIDVLERAALRAAESC